MQKNKVIASNTEASGSLREARFHSEFVKNRNSAEGSEFLLERAKTQAQRIFRFLHRCFSWSYNHYSQTCGS